MNDSSHETEDLIQREREKFLLHSWLRPDGTCSVYVYYATSDILDPSEKKQQRWTLSLAGDLTVNNSLQRIQNYKEEKENLKQYLTG